MIRRGQNVAEELLGSRSIPVLRQIEVERGAVGVDGSIQIDPAPGDAKIGFVDTPGRARAFQLPPHPAVEFGA
jgi:hypothetical protein